MWLAIQYSHTISWTISLTGTISFAWLKVFKNSPLTYSPQIYSPPGETPLNRAHVAILMPFLPERPFHSAADIALFPPPILLALRALLLFRLLLPATILLLNVIEQLGPIDML